ncbi:MAG: NADH-quinone oxidoreductase subunit C [Candidatus Cloacimonetes bacterium]|nr:NADH-quinone oxidoreductase subunit C [Candidatus Cloacimonadota bacterium]
MKEFIEKLIDKYAIKPMHSRHANQVFLTIKQDRLPDALTWLRDFAGYTHLAFITAVDYPEIEKIQLTYMVHNYQENTDIGLRVLLDRRQPEMISVHHLWQHVATYQRELHEMFGIDFPGSPRLKENFALEGWQDVPPMRRDFDTKEYAEKTYFPRPGRETHDPREYMKQKLYPDPKEEK